VDSCDALTWGELRSVLDEELGRLASSFSAPLILCYLEGQTQDEAARRLGWSKSTLRRRLERGRGLLQTRLARRGVTLSAGLVTPLLFGTATSAAVSKAVTAATVKTSLLFGSGQSTGAAIMAKPVVLAEAVLRSMTIANTKWVTGMVLTLCLLTGGGLGVYHAVAGMAAQAPRPTIGQGPGPLPATPDRTDAKPAQLAWPTVDRFGDPLPEEAIARLGTIRLRHGASPRALVFAPDNKSLASAGMDGTVHIWGTDSGKELLRIENKRFPNSDLASVNSLAYTPDGKTLAGARLNDPACLWDVATGKELLQFGGKRHRASWVVFSPDGKSLAYGGGATDPVVRLAEVNTGKDVRQFGEHKGFVTKVAFSPDGTMLVSADDEMLRIFDVATGRARDLSQADGKPVRFTSLAFSPDGKTLAAASGPGKMIWLADMATGKGLHTIRLAERESVEQVVFSPDSKTMISGHDDGVVRFWEVASGTKTRQFRAHGDTVIALALSRDGQTLATSCNSGNGDNAVRLWEAATGKPLVRYPGPQQGVHHVVFSPDGKQVATSNGEGAVHAWEAATGQLLHHWERHGALAFMPDSQTVVCGGWRDGQVYFLNLATGKETRQFPAHEKGIGAICLTRDGKTLATAGWDGFIRLWELDSGKQLQDFGGKQKGFVVAGLALSPDGKLLASIHENSILRLWDTASGKLLREDDDPNHVGSVTFSPDGKLLAYTTRMGVPGAVPMVRIREVATGSEIRQLKGNAHDTLVFSPDSRTLIWGSELWEVATGQQRRKFPWHQGYVGCVAFSTNGRLIAAGSSNASVLIWDIAGQHDRQGPPTPINATRLDKLWSDLAAADAPTGYQAICTLRASARQCIQLFEQHLKPVPRADSKRVAEALRNLDSAQFTVRNDAAKELEHLGEAAEMALRQVLTENPSLEVRQRVEKLLDRIGGAHQLRQARALEVLEQLGNSESRRLLLTLAGGSPQAGLTRYAQAALDRLAQ
jgi:WD40 repeat protein